jgi:hypothetical protein
MPPSPSNTLLIFRGVLFWSVFEHHVDLVMGEDSVVDGNAKFDGQLREQPHCLLARIIQRQGSWTSFGKAWLKVFIFVSWIKDQALL